MPVHRLLAAAILSVLGGCVASTAPQPGAISSRSISDGWFADEHLTDAPAPGRVGKTPEGFAYTIYHDGSGSLDTGIVDWSLDCTRDAMNDRRECTMNPWVSETKLFVAFDASGLPQSVCVFGHDFPGRTAMIRVDSRPAHQTDTAGCIAARVVLSELMIGLTVTTRAVKWPYDYGRDNTGSLSGFARAVELARFITLNIDRLSF